MSVHSLTGSGGGGDNGDGGGDNAKKKLEALRRQFLVDDDLSASHYVGLMAKAAPFCRLNKEGHVDLFPTVTGGAKVRIQLTLSARLIGAGLDARIKSDVLLAELAKITDLSESVVSARCAELLKARIIESPRRGVYRMAQNRVERFLDSLPAVAA